MMAPSVTDNPPSRNCNDDENDDLSLPISAGVIINYDSDNESESESEDPANSGYELLPQEPDNDSMPSLGAREDEEHNEGVLDNDDQDGAANIQNSSTKMTSSEEQHFESASCVTDSITTTPIMDQDHINKIKAAMAGFNLPLTSIPSWANSVPEEDWSSHLLQRLNMHKGQQVNNSTDKRREQAISENPQQEISP